MSYEPNKNRGSLLSSAQEFLVESLRNFASDKLNFAIVHAVTAAELVLKERLFRENQALILRNIDTKQPHREHSVELSRVPRRLENLGMPLAPADEQLVRDMAKWRNQIIHHMPVYEPETVRKQLPKLLDFLAGFLRSELDTPLEEFLPRELYRHATKLLSDWQNAVEAARVQAAATGSVATGVACPTCGEVEVVSLGEDGTAECHLCGRQLYVVNRCDGCGRKMATSYEPHPGENYCEECIAAAGDQYISSYVDLMRGK